MNSSTAFNMSGGVYVYTTSTFTKTNGGTIYGYTNGNVNSNVIKNSSGVVQNNKGHAVFLHLINRRRDAQGSTALSRVT